MARMWKHALIAALLVLPEIALSQSLQRPTDKPSPTRVGADAGPKFGLYELKTPSAPARVKKPIIRGARRFET